MSSTTSSLVFTRTAESTIPCDGGNENRGALDQGVRNDGAHGIGLNRPLGIALTDY